jgi:hypothetical protein
MTNYIARTNGGQDVLEIREGVLTDIAGGEQKKWRVVYEKPRRIQFKDPEPRIPVSPQFKVIDGRVTMVWCSDNAPQVWIKFNLKKRAAALRWQLQQSPLLLSDGTLIDATESSKAKIDQALTVLEKGWTNKIDFKAQNGWIVVNLAKLTALAQRMVSREQALFSAEKDLADAIDGGIITTTDEVDNWPWPT